MLVPLLAVLGALCVFSIVCGTQVFSSAVQTILCLLSPLTAVTWTNLMKVDNLQIYISLWRLGHAESCAAVGERFGVGAETVRRACHHFNAAVVGRYWEQHVQMPT